jgi:hypothetical protein
MKKSSKNSTRKVNKKSILSWKKFLNITTGSRLKISLLTVITIIASVFPYNMIQNERAKKLISTTFRAIGVQSSVVSEGLNYEQSQALEKNISSVSSKIKDEQVKSILNDYAQLNQAIFTAGGISSLSSDQRTKAKNLLDQINALEKKGIELDSSQDFLHIVIGDSANISKGKASNISTEQNQDINSFMEKFLQSWKDGDIVKFKSYLSVGVESSMDLENRFGEESAWQMIGWRLNRVEDCNNSEPCQRKVIVDLVNNSLEWPYSLSYCLIKNQDSYLISCEHY